MAVNWELEKKPQREKVLDLLWDGKWHAHHEIDRAISPGKGTRYGGRIGELREHGWMVVSRPIDGDKINGNEYRLLSRKQGPPWVTRVKVYLREDDVVEMLERGTVGTVASAFLREALDTFRKGSSAKKAELASDRRRSWFASNKSTDFNADELAYLRACRDPFPQGWDIGPSAGTSESEVVDIAALLNDLD